MGQTTGGFSSTEVFRRIASNDWIAGSTITWSPSPSATRYVVGEYLALVVTGTCTLTVAGNPTEFDYVIVGGGGAGGNRGYLNYSAYAGGGGGAGGVARGKVTLPAGSYSVSIGSGGSATSRTNGAPSYLVPSTPSPASDIAIVGIGGGVGAGSPYVPGDLFGPIATFGQPGGSGGGSGTGLPSGNGLAVSAPQGFPGGAYNPLNIGTGGGGAASSGYASASVSPATVLNPIVPAPITPSYTGTQGGEGVLIEFSGIPTWVGGGGGGGAYIAPTPLQTNNGYFAFYGGRGGIGGGGNAGRNGYQVNYYEAPTAGSPNTGGGGGAATTDDFPTYRTPSNFTNYYPYWTNAANGGSGVLFLRWKK